MRKWLLAAGLVAAIVVVVALVSGGGGGSSGYVVRGIFDSGGFGRCRGSRRCVPSAKSNRSV